MMYIPLLYRTPPNCERNNRLNIKFLFSYFYLELIHMTSAADSFVYQLSVQKRQITVLTVIYCLIPVPACALCLILLWVIFPKIIHISPLVHIKKHIRIRICSNHCEHNVTSAHPAHEVER